VHAEAHTHNTISQTAERIRELDRIYSFESMVIDQAGSVLTAIEDIKARFSLPLIPAKKNDKLGHIRLLNSDFASSTIYLLAGTTEPLQKELASHQWKDSMHRKEHDASPNHCCDALLYVWRTIKRGEATAPPPTTHDPLQEAKEAFQRILNKNREEREISRDIGLYL
jgi:hypothetical protein